MSSEGLLLVGHGTASPAGRAELLALGESVAAALPHTSVETGFVELCDPPAGVALDKLVDTGCERVAVVPLMLNSAGHAKSDVPAVVVAARARHPGVFLCYGRPIGPDHTAVEIVCRRIADAGATGWPLVVVARGTSDPEANAEGAKAARMVAEWSRPPFVVTAYSGLTWPLVPEALDQARRLGAERVAVVAWYLCTGVLVERIGADARRWSGATGVPVADCGYLGPDPALVPVVVDRYLEAVGALVPQNCDACSYRKPWPGLEDRVGQPIGVGHSRLAAAHRHR